MNTYNQGDAVEVHMHGDWIGGVVVSEVKPSVVYEIKTYAHNQAGKFNVSRIRTPAPKPVGRPAFFDEDRARIVAYVPESLKKEFKKLPGSMTGNLITAMKAYVNVKKHYPGLKEEDDGSL